MSKRDDYQEEKRFLEEVSATYRNNKSPISKWSIDAYTEIYKQYIDKGKRGLELGCSNGYSTECLADFLGELDVVDGSKNMIERARKYVTHKNVRFRYGLFEELSCEEEYDYIFCSYVLEHVLKPEDILEICYKILKKNGKMFITVPNATALSRQMALAMGLIEDLYNLTENDLAHGHRRVFDIDKLESLVSKSPFRMIAIGGTYLKPFADFQLNQMIESGIIGTEQLVGMEKLAEKYPNMAGSIYTVLEK